MNVHAGSPYYMYLKGFLFVFLFFFFCLGFYRLQKTGSNYAIFFIHCQFISPIIVNILKQKNPIYLNRYNLPFFCFNVRKYMYHRMTKTLA